MKNNGRFLLDKRLEMLDRDDRRMRSSKRGVGKQREHQLNLIGNGSNAGYVGGGGRKKSRSGRGRAAAPKLANYLSTGSFVPAGGRMHHSSPVVRNRRIFLGILAGMSIFIIVSVLKRL